MPKRPVELPDNLADCHALIARQADRIEELEADVDQLRVRVDELVAEVAALKRQLYGSRRERFVPQQPDQPQPAAELLPLLPAPEARPQRTSPGRRPRTIDPTIPREKVYHRLREEEVAPEAWHHPRARRFFRFVREEVELPQRRLRVIEHYQEVIVVEDEEQVESTMQAAQVPGPVLPSCYVGPSLLAYLAASRFADYLPYDREEDILARSGFSIHRSTQWRWMRGLSGKLNPLVELMRQRTRRSRVLGMDETPCPILCPHLGRTRSA